MPGQGRLDGNARGFKITHLADHDDVRILSHDGTQRAGKVKPDGGLGLNLVNALDLVLNGIFNGDDLALGRVELAQGGIKRGCLTRTRRTGDEDDAVGHLKGLDESPAGVTGPT